MGEERSEEQKVVSYCALVVYSFLSLLSSCPPYLSHEFPLLQHPRVPYQEVHVEPEVQVEGTEVSEGGYYPPPLVVRGEDQGLVVVECEGGHEL